jgi:hypothetical protein
MLRMNVTKLTLSVSPVLVKKGKRIAKKRNRSLSALISNFLENLEEPVISKTEFTPQIEQMCGAYHLPKDKNEHDIRFNSLIKKHLHV